MNIYPTRTTALVVMAGIFLLGLGVLQQKHMIVAWAGGMLIGVSWARAVTLVSVMRIRTAGFEMLWLMPTRVVRIASGETVVLEAEVRNRDTLVARFDRLRVISSPALDVSVEPVAGEVPASGSVRLTLRVRGLRVGYHGIHGLTLEVRGAPKLFEVPLTFANPFGLTVIPRVAQRMLAMPHGGRSRRMALAGRESRLRGDGTEFRELRDHLPGDSFRRIAWKASAKRGTLVVREFEREQRDVVALLLDASVELWSGPMGQAPLDRAIEMMCGLALRHIANGDMVGLRLVAGRELGATDYGFGRGHLARMAETIIEYCGVLDADRCAWDESELALHLLEHLRLLDVRAPRTLSRARLDEMVARASAVLRRHAPFSRPPPYGRSARDARLRRYAACFGVYAPARLEPDRLRTSKVFSEVMIKLADQRAPSISVAHVVAPPPPESELFLLRKAVRRLRAKRVTVRWSCPPVATALFAYRGGDLALESVRGLVEKTVVTRAALAQRRGIKALRRMGVGVVDLGKRRVRSVEALDEEPPSEHSPDQGVVA